MILDTARKTLVSKPRNHVTYYYCHFIELFISWSHRAKGGIIADLHKRVWSPRGGSYVDLQL